MASLLMSKSQQLLTDNLHEVHAVRFVLAGNEVLLPIIVDKRHNLRAQYDLKREIGLRLLFSEEFGGEVFAVHSGNVGDGDFFGAFGFAGVGVTAIAEAEAVHFGDHVLHAPRGFDLPLR